MPSPFEASSSSFIPRRSRSIIPFLGAPIAIMIAMPGPLRFMAGFRFLFAALAFSITASIPLALAILPPSWQLPRKVAGED